MSKLCHNALSRLGWYPVLAKYGVALWFFVFFVVLCPFYAPGILGTCDGGGVNLIRWSKCVAQGLLNWMRFAGFVG